MAVNYNNPTFGAYQYPMNPFPQQVTSYPLGANGYQNPLQTYQNQVQPQQSSMSVNKINGRVVNSLEEISPGEVAMDGSVSIFPFLDGSCVYTKNWNSNGSISTVKYVPETIEANSEAACSENFQQKIDERLTKIEELLQSICS